MQLDERTIHRYLVFAILSVHFMGLFVDVLDNGASQYASIAMEMVQDGHWLQIQHRHAPYIGNPPLLFWFSAISFKLFGISNFAFKLPAFLFTILTMYATYKLTKKFHGQRAGRMASIIIGSTQALFLLSFDVHAESFLVGIVIFSIWQITEYIDNQHFNNLFLGSVGIALALLTKGPIGILVPVLIIGSDLLLRKQWKTIFKWQWLIGIGIIVLLLLPMLYGLYEQFDKQSEILMDGPKGISGVSFFWESNFGLTDDFFELKESNLLYYIVAAFAAFFPWTIVLISALIHRIRFFRNRNRYPEYISLTGFILPIIVLFPYTHSIRHLFVVIPFASMMIGAYLAKISVKSYKTNLNGQLVLLFLLWILAFILLFYIFTPTNIVMGIIALMTLGLLLWSLKKLPKMQVLVFVSTLTALGLNFVLNGHAYPKLLKYQSTSQLGHWLKDNPKEREHIACFRIHMDALDFYGRSFFPIRKTVRELTQNDNFLYTDKSGLLALKKAGIHFVKMKTYDDFRVGKLTQSFLNPAHRKENITKRYLIAIYPEQ